MGHAREGYGREKRLREGDYKDKDKGRELGFVVLRLMVFVPLIQTGLLRSLLLKMIYFN